MKKIFLSAALALTGFSAMAQAPISATGNEWLIQECRRLYSDKEYPAMLTVANKIESIKMSKQEKQEHDYLIATATFHINPTEGRALILQYLDSYPESAKKDLLAVYIAESYYYQHKFELAKEWFAKSDMERLSPEERERATLYRALTAQETGNHEFAQQMLKVMKATSKRYKSDAIFHLAAIDYYNEDLESAYEGFKSIELDDKYYLDVPYYLAGIYLKNGEYLRAEKLARLYLEHNDHLKQSIPMRHILGGALYGQTRYKEAIPYLKEYIQQCNRPQRIAYYQLAMSYFATGQYNDAIPLFDKCTNEDDVMAQNSYLHLGIIQLKFNDLTNARLAFEQAAAMSNDNSIREEALYNYALCIHQTRYSPFAESVKVFERFLNEYPASVHVPQVEKYLVEVYMNTRNYDVALQSINKIQKPSAEILKAKQNILYRLGVQSLIDNDPDKAIEYMTQSIALSQYNNDTYSDALYWRGEAYYSKGNYKKAAIDYKGTLAVSPRNSNDAMYSLAYTQFQQGKYNESLRTFDQFLRNATADKAAQRADAYNRIGDCYFYNRNYNTATQYYKRAAETDKKHSDYALYRAGVAQGLTKDYTGKITTLKQLIAQYPNSSYAEQAYYETGRSYVEQENHEQAIAVFEELVKKYPKSSLARRAAIETAMIYNQEGKYSKATAAYKQIIRDYPHSEEAQVAAQDLKNIYVEQDKIGEYAAFAATAPGMKALESSERDTLTYTAAEKIYGRQRYDEACDAFKRYLKEFPEGSFILDSHYYLGIIYYNRKAPLEALSHFNKVITFPDNKYSEESMALAAELYHSDEKYSEALSLYKELLDKTSDEERRKACRMNIMRCAYITGEPNTAIETATELLEAGNISPEWEREAHYTRAKSLISENRSSEAMNDLTTLASDTRSKQGAEAKYLVAQHYFDNKQYDACEKEVLNYIETSTPHAYWLARSFVLLADLYTAQGRNIEAKQYLLSLQNNYNANDNIAEMIKERLSKQTENNE